MKKLFMLIVVSACILSGCQSNSTEVNQDFLGYIHLATAEE